MLFRSWRVAYAEPSRRPTDGRYGQNPNRLQHYYQYQVIIKPAPSNILDLYIQSLVSLSIDLCAYEAKKRVGVTRSGSFPSVT